MAKTFSIQVKGREKGPIVHGALVTCSFPGCAIKADVPGFLFSGPGMQGMKDAILGGLRHRDWHRRRGEHRGRVTIAVEMGGRLLPAD